ncbi:unnamed protein product [Rangifer tarandus platyrhynchus]|uniref:Uncharacterized protein n=2 Tax=Rangifer tarandus platyrhynchus TaxID=3082113 RepID=A0AC59ZK38_RANTA|nr:unnamed protein product [Rangifer tarandus platyrhynchus]
MEILQARILQWVTVASPPRDRIQSPVLQADALPSEPPEVIAVTAAGKRRGPYELCSVASETQWSCYNSRTGEAGSIPWIGKILWSKKGKPTPVCLPGKFHGQRSLMCCSP